MISESLWQKHPPKQNYSNSFTGRPVTVSLPPNIPAETTITPLLACDVGNSRVKFGLFDAGRPPDAGQCGAAHSARPAMLPECRLSFTADRTAAVKWEELLQQVQSVSAVPLAGVLAGSHPEGREKIRREWIAHLGRAPREISAADVQVCLPIAVEEPQKVGMDRLLNAVAANVIRPAGRPAVIVDCGTATTVDFVDAGGTFRGGAILPGFELAARSLHEYTALLPYIDMAELATGKPAALGTHTRAALCSGLFWGQVGAVKELVEQLSRLPAQKESASAADNEGDEQRSEQLPPVLILTGGGAGLLADSFTEAVQKPHLSLQGLVLAAGRSAISTFPLPVDSATES